MRLITCAAALLLVQRPVLVARPHLVPRVVLPGEGVTGLFWRSAPIIGIVTVGNVRRAGPDLEITPGKIYVHLAEAEAAVESVIQGPLAPGPARFYFFTNSLIPDIGYPTPLLWFEPGRRYAVFLRMDGGMLRTMTDLTGPNIRIRSGRHFGPAKSAGQPFGGDPGATLALLALTPATDHEKGFAVGIEDTYDRLLPIAGPGVLARSLKGLLSGPRLRDTPAGLPRPLDSLLLHRSMLRRPSRVGGPCDQESGRGLEAPKASHRAVADEDP